VPGRRGIGGGGEGHRRRLGRLSFSHEQAVKRAEPALYRPPWLFPDTKQTGGDAHLA